MNKIVSKLSAFALFVIVGVSACKSDDPKTSCQNGNFEMTFNGEHVTGISFNNTMLKGNSFGTDGKRMDIRATDATGRQLIITFSDLTNGTAGNCMSTDPYVSFDNVFTGTENAFFFTIIESGVSYPVSDGNLDITSCDANAMRISGTFSFSDNEYEVTDGSFTNMCYTIVQ